MAKYFMFDMCHTINICAGDGLRIINNYLTKLGNDIFFQDLVVQIKQLVKQFAQTWA